MPKKETQKINNKNTARVLEAPKYRSFRLQKRLPKQQRTILPGSFKIWQKSLSILKQNWRLFTGMTVVYAILNILFVQGFFNANVTELRDTLDTMTGSGLWKALAAVPVVWHMFGTAGLENATAAYRFILLVIGSLATIWALRQTYAGSKSRIRDGYYEGMYPFVPFVLVLFVLLLQLIPLTLGLFLFGSVGAANGAEVVMWVVVLSALLFLTLYMLSSTVFALYVVCLPRMTPVAALRSAVSLVRHRRLAVVVRTLMLPIMLLLMVGLVMLPIIFWLPVAAAVCLFILSMTVLPIVHSYMYALYRELINE